MNVRRSTVTRVIAGGMSDDLLVGSREYWEDLGPELRTTSSRDEQPPSGDLDVRKTQHGDYA